jgi:serine/threonine-protein kinase SRPK3
MCRLIVQSAARKQLPTLRACSPFQQAAGQRNVMSAPAPAPVYRHIDDVERLKFYQPDGYHPIEIGNCLNQRYRIVHKLGHGTYSTAWLARDEQRSRFVAVKIGTADAIQMSQREIDVLTQLTCQSVKQTHCRRFLTLPVLDSFSLTGPNGKHSCFVTVPARCSLSHTISISGPKFFHLKVARALAAQLVQAVAHVHDCGYVHGGKRCLPLFVLILHPGVPAWDFLTRSSLRSSLGKHLASVAAQS